MLPTYYKLLICNPFSTQESLTIGSNWPNFDVVNFHTMRKVIFLFFLCAISPKIYSQWVLLSNDYCPNISVTAFNSSVISGASSFGPFDFAVSYDNGINWIGSNLNPSNGIIHLTTSDSMIYASTPNGVYRSEKDELYWSAYNQGLPNGQIIKTCLKDSIILASNNNTIFKRLIGENAWTTICESSPVAGIYDFDFDGNRIVVAGNSGIAESIDMGLNWIVWPTVYISEWNAVGIKGDYIIAASKGGIYMKHITTGTISLLSAGLIKLWNPYGYDYYGEFEMFLLVDNNIFVCGQTGVYKLSENNLSWEHTGLEYWTYALSCNEEMLFAAKGYGGIWGRPLNQLISKTNEITAMPAEVIFYPNPTTENIFILTKFSLEKKTMLTIINLNNQVVLQRHITSQTEIINVSGFPNGMYFIQLTEDNENRTAKFVKH